MNKKNTLPKYDYSRPIKLLQYKAPRFDIIFYSALLSAMMLAVIWLIFIHDGKFKIDFVLWRVLICIPLVMLCYWVKELLELTGKDEKDTKRIMDHVFESCFIVDQKNLKN